MGLMPGIYVDVDRRHVQGTWVSGSQRECSGSTFSVSWGTNEILGNHRSSEIWKEKRSPCRRKVMTTRRCSVTKASRVKAFEKWELLRLSNALEMSGKIKTFKKIDRLIDRQILKMKILLKLLFWCDMDRSQIIMGWEINRKESVQ